MVALVAMAVASAETAAVSVVAAWHGRAERGRAASGRGHQTESGCGHRMESDCGCSSRTGNVCGSMGYVCGSMGNVCGSMGYVCGSMGYEYGSMGYECAVCVRGWMECERAACGGAASGGVANGCAWTANRQVQHRARA